MAYEKDRLPLACCRRFHACHRLSLKLQITDGQHFVNDENIRIQWQQLPQMPVAQTSHCCSVSRRYRESLGICEIDDGVKLLINFTTHAENRAVQIDVLPPRQFGMESGADFQQASNPAIKVDLTGRRLGNPAEDLE